MGDAVNQTPAPNTLEGWYALHDFRTIDWSNWKQVEPAKKQAIIDEAKAFFDDSRAVKDADEGASGLFTMLGHKADLMILHLRPTVDDLNRLELAFMQTQLADFTVRSYSYVSVTELAQYTSGGGAERTPQQQAFIDRRLKPEIPDYRYVSFYPMTKKRDEVDNWYTLDHDQRVELMRGHGRIGRSYAGQVQQMITGSMGFDDWEWGVTLYGKEALPLKKIVQEMRFDEASSKYGLFGAFLFGIQLQPEDLADFLAGRLK